MKAMKYLLQIACLLAVCCLFGCKKDSDDYQPPTKGNVPETYFVETTWRVSAGNVFIPDTVPDICIANMTRIYFGTQTCILTAKIDQEKEYAGTYRIENIGKTITRLYLDDLTYGDESYSYVLNVDELNIGKSSVSLLLNVQEGSALPKKEKGYGTLQLTK